MTNTEFLAFLFLGFLAAIVFGIFFGIWIAERRKQRQVSETGVKVNRNLEAIRDRAFARLDGTPKNILDAEVIE
jgi:hypothetical protein